MYHEWFYSQSPEDWKRWLSNFTCYNTNSMYPSIESQYQALKYCYSNKPSHRHSIPWSRMTPNDIIYVGSKKYFEQHKIKLDTDKWEKDKLIIMKELLRIRWKKDPHFRNILTDLTNHNVKLYYFCVHDNFWGAYQDNKTGKFIGENKLGQLMNEVADEMVLKQKLSKIFSK